MEQAFAGASAKLRENPEKGGIPVPPFKILFPGSIGADEPND